ncbi:hypothetical protein GCM10017044_04390 [Kordiimonas sediminis]|uniref:Uncharacterized protein n=1 Tax=Kordiimonas sediminis TaxID=1735581 RepID=A0A919ALD1_9PROT|nr:hypothetical protein [Kordiimonas sediminis]GHF13474.1 hypothetical protein GCM10017044_04390 [Kordiimonas sediminis]
MVSVWPDAKPNTYGDRALSIKALTGSIMSGSAPIDSVLIDSALAGTADCSIASNAPEV